MSSNNLEKRFPFSYSNSKNSFDEGSGFNENEWLNIGVDDYNVNGSPAMKGEWDDDWDDDWEDRINDSFGYDGNQNDDDDVDFLMNFIQNPTNMTDIDSKNENVIKFDQISKDTLEWMNKEYITAIGIKDWSIYFSIQAEMALTNKNFKLALMSSMATEVVNSNAEKHESQKNTRLRKDSIESDSSNEGYNFEDIACPNMTQKQTIIRNLVIQFIAVYQLGFRKKAESMKEIILKNKIEVLEKALSEPLCKLMQDTMEAMEFLPAFLDYLQSQQTSSHHQETRSKNSSGLSHRKTKLLSKKLTQQKILDVANCKDTLTPLISSDCTTSSSMKESRELDIDVSQITKMQAQRNGKKSDCEAEAKSTDYSISTSPTKEIKKTDTLSESIVNPIIKKIKKEQKKGSSFVVPTSASGDDESDDWINENSDNY